MDYKQCKFSNSGIFQIAWVENKPGLKVGANVELKSDNHTKWLVEEIYPGKQSAEMIQELSSDYKTQRRASDI